MNMQIFYNCNINDFFFFCLQKRLQEISGFCILKHFSQFLIGSTKFLVVSFVFFFSFLFLLLIIVVIFSYSRSHVMIAYWLSLAQRCIAMAPFFETRSAPFILYFPFVRFVSSTIFRILDYTSWHALSIWIIFILFPRRKRVSPFFALGTPPAPSFPTSRSG